MKWYVRGIFSVTTNSENVTLKILYEQIVLHAASMVLGANSVGSINH